MLFFIRMFIPSHLILHITSPLVQIAAIYTRMPDHTALLPPRKGCCLVIHALTPDLNHTVGIRSTLVQSPPACPTVLLVHFALPMAA